MAILCRTSHFAPRMTPTRYLHSINARVRKTVLMTVLAAAAGVATGLGMLLACEFRIDTLRKPAHASEGFRRRVGRFATTEALMEASKAAASKPKSAALRYHSRAFDGSA